MTAEVAASISAQRHRAFPLLAQIAALLPVGQNWSDSRSSGLAGQAGAAFAAMIALGIAGGAIGAIRVGGWLAVIALGSRGRRFPWSTSVRAHRRLEKFTEQFPDALDMVTRACGPGTLRERDPTRVRGDA